MSSLYQLSIHIKPIMYQKVPETIHVQFLLIAYTAKGKRIEKRLHHDFKQPLTAANIAQQRATFKQQYETRGYKAVSVYSYPPHLQTPLES